MTQPHTTTRATQHTRLHLSLLLAFWISSLWASLIAAAPLPNLGSSDLIEYTREKEQALGRAFKSALHEEYNILNDPDITHYIQRLGHKIAQHSADERDFTFYVINNPDINAFAGPDGVIGIHTGLIQAVTSEDELASVIAHEIAHVTQNHLSRTYEIRSDSSLSSLASFIAAILIGMHDSSAGMAALMGSMGASMQQQLKHSRTHEAEADFAGIDYLYKSGYNPYAMSDFFGRLAQKYRHSEFKPIEILSTHPVTEHRLAEAKSRAEQFPPMIFKREDDTLTLIKLKLSTLTQTTDPVLDRTRLDAQQSCYQKGLQAIAENRPKTMQQAKQCLQTVIDQNPRQSLYLGLLLELHLLTDKAQIPDDTLKLAEFANELYPQDPSILLRYARLLARQSDLQKAIDLLQTQAPRHTYQHALYKLLAQLHAQRHEMDYSYYYEALAYFNIGHIPRTRVYLNKALENLSKTSTTLNTQIQSFQRRHANLLKEKDKN